tara:strand:+ start:70 stop:486 length:417 start_codon:yes stop_codon:yes gene_type:complete
LKKISDKDKQDWESFINSKNKIFDKDKININKNLPYSEKTIDLHGFTLENANLEVEKFIYYCFENGITKINIITGKGNRSKNKNDPYQSKDLSILKYSVPNYIKGNKSLMEKISKIDFQSIESPSKGNFEIILRKKNV